MKWQKPMLNWQKLEFQQLVRKLKFQLHSDLFALGQQKFLLDTYNKQLALLDTILSTYQVQTIREIFR